MRNVNDSLRWRGSCPHLAAQQHPVLRPAAAGPEGAPPRDGGLQPPHQHPEVLLMGVSINLNQQ